MYTLNCNGRLLSITRPVVMGIINATPDSFYSNSRAVAVNAAVKQAANMMANGASVLDIGGQSTAPGSEPVSEWEEARRVVPVIEAVHEALPEAFISVDTFYASVAQQAVAAGACMVNDISGGTLDSNMLSTVAALKVPYVLMHMKGTPQTMQQLAVYEDVVQEVLDFFIHQIARCTAAGIHDIIVDPGFGFAKTISHNFALLKKMNVLSMLQKPILAGLSRKATIYKTLGTSPAEALNGTTVLNTIALLHGASILRVHDVREAAEAITLVQHAMPG